MRGRDGGGFTRSRETTSSSSGVRPNQQPTPVTSKKVHRREPPHPPPKKRVTATQMEIEIWTRYYLFAGKQLIYLIPNDAVLTTKIGLLSSLRECEAVSNNIRSSRALRSRTVFPWRHTCHHQRFHYADKVVFWMFWIQWLELPNLNISGVCVNHSGDSTVVVQTV